MDSDLKTCEHSPVNVERALEIVDEYYSRADTFFENSEDALAATMFGFSRSASEFIEFCVNGSSSISYKFEWSDPSSSWLHKMFGGTFQFETTLQSKSQMNQRVQEFFTMTSAAIKEKIKSAS